MGLPTAIPITEPPTDTPWAKNFPKVCNFGKVELRFMAILLKNAQNPEGSKSSQLIANQHVKPAPFLETAQVWC